VKIRRKSHVVVVDVAEKDEVDVGRVKTAFCE